MSSLYSRNGIYYYKGFGKRLSLKTHNKAIAQKLKREYDKRFMLEKAQGIDIVIPELNPSKALLFQDAINRYLKYKSQNFELKTVRTDTQRLRWIVKHVGNIKINDITVDTIIDYVEFRKKTVKSSTIRIDLIVWKAFLSYYQKRKLINDNPFNLYPIKGTGNKVNYLSLAEIKRLMVYENYNHPWLSGLIKMALLTGFRRGELINLKWEDIRRTSIQVKGKSGRRDFPINDKLQNFIEGLSQNGDYIFHPGKHVDKPLNEDYVSRQVRNVFNELGFQKEYTLHTLRHTFASHLALTGHSIQEISVLLGHTNIQVTMIYSHLQPKDSKFKLPYE